MLFILLQMPSWFTGFNFLLGLMGFIVIVGGALAVMFYKGRDQENTSLTGLLKIREQEKTDCDKKCAECSEELEAVTAELRAQGAIILADLVKYREDYENHQVEVEGLRRRVRILEKVDKTP